MVAQVFPERLAQQFVVTIGQDTGVRLADRARQLSLRSRVTLLFLMTGLVAALLLSGASYITARTYLLQRRDEIVERQAFNNAQLIRTQLRTRRSEAFELIRYSN